MATKEGIVLIGMMGSGKTTLGEGLASRLKQPFVDTDKLVERLAGMTCAQLANHKTRNFGDTQTKAILRHRPNGPQVIATGGSVPLYREPMDYLSSLGKVIFLNVDPGELETRLDPRRIAGLVNPDNLSFAELYARRMNAYQKVADAVLEVGPGETAEQTLPRLIAVTRRLVGRSAVVDTPARPLTEQRFNPDWAL